MSPGYQIKHFLGIFAYLRLHLRSLFWVNLQNVLVMANGVQAVFVLSADVALQGLEDTVGLRKLNQTDEPDREGKLAQ